MAWKTWDDAFLHHRGKGCDPSDAAYRADEWQKRQKHCRGAVRHEWDWRVPENAKEVIELLQRRITVHAHWRDFLKANPDQETDAGTAQSNQRYIDQYEAAICVIEARL